MTASRPIGAVLLLVLFSLVAGCASGRSPKAEEQAERRKRTVIITKQDDVRVGREGAEEVERAIGTLDSPELVAYVDRIGQKLVRALPTRDFAFHFKIVDQMEPNAFALPGGFIFVSRGLLALANSEDELACVLGHEVIHAWRRHSALQQSVARSLPKLTLPRSRAATMAAYGRDMEREADEMGQRLAAAAGYDPMGMSTFMRRLDQRERLLIGAKRRPTFADTHPGTRERATSNAIRSRELRWARDPGFGDPRERLLDRIDGMAIGDRPETGVFEGSYFLHPALDFEIRFPRGWIVQNSSLVVGAQSPRRDAVVFLTGDMPEGDLVELADGFVEEIQAETSVEVRSRKRVKLGEIDAVRYMFHAGPAGRKVEAWVTFFPFAGSTWRIIGVTSVASGDKFAPQFLLTTRTFAPLAPERRSRIVAHRLRIALARRGENVKTFGERVGSRWSPSETALINGYLGNETFDGGELMKILQRESFVPPSAIGH